MYCLLGRNVNIQCVIVSARVLGEDNDYKSEEWVLAVQPTIPVACRDTLEYLASLSMSDWGNGRIGR